MIIINSLISYRDTIHDISVFYKGKLAFHQCFMNNFTDTVGKNLGQDLVGAEIRLMGRKYLMAAAPFFLGIKVKKVAFKSREEYH